MDPTPWFRLFRFCLNKPWFLLILDEILWQPGPQIKALFPPRYAKLPFPHCSSPRLH